MIISIIIATYNADKTLMQCLESIVSQKNDNVELILIDAKSKDKTCEIIKSFSDKIDYFISENDQGVYDAWNKGIKVARGRWIMFLGADDKLLPNAIDSYLNYLESTDSSEFDYISARNEFINDRGRLLKIVGNGAQWSLMKNGMSAAHVASLHNKRNLFDTVGLYNLNYKICSDYEMLLRKKDNLKTGFLNTTIAQMKAGGISFSTKAIKESYKIRELHRTVSRIKNLLLYFRDLLGYASFRLRKFV
ncbi:glycosyltransferase family 2 protein [Dyadobacter sp. MSC1_007]|jgi:glycosyltransferase involved in cell wall biosynthesis|uniref:glycosyltransferase family 2 protein n=1 Tax=Dyadobacter sp. MSC1_007 TaxID=2909264 RepID=UPI0020309032|nr:glycosyltransferase family 2 protein [Dyadobacter sp. MSC1_007]